MNVTSTPLSAQGFQPAGRPLRVVAIQWIAGAYLLILGMSLLLLTPGSLGPLLGLVWLRGALSAAGGLALLWVAGTGLPRRHHRAIQILAILPQVAFGIEYMGLGVYSAGATLLAIALGIMLAALARPATLHDGPRPDVAGLVLGAAQASQGLDLLLRPGAAVAVPPRLGIAATTVGGLFLVAGVLVVLVQLLEGTRFRVPSSPSWAVHAVSGGLLLALWAAQSALLDPVYWVLGAAVVLRGLGTALLPRLSSQILTLDRDSMRPRLALALVTAALLPLLVVVTILVDAGVVGNTLRARQVSFAIMVLTSAACGLLGAWFASRLSRPLGQLLNGVDAIAAGVRPVQLDGDGPTELRRLRDAVGTMAHTLDLRAEERERLAQEKAVLAERQRLARDLHDSVSQALFGVTLAAHSALAHWEDKPELAHARVEQAQLLAKTAQAEMRALIFELRPDQLETDGLVKALELQTAALAQRREFAVDVTLCDEPDLPLHVKEAFYRVAQEAVQNAQRHARPKRLVVRLSNGDKVRLVVQDDGRGFDPTASYPGHLGLRSMRERAEAIGAELIIESDPSGSCVQLSYPH